MSSPYTIDQVELALRNAHMAGDREGATRIAEELAKMRDVQTKQMREDTSSGATLQFGPFDTGVKIPQWLDEGLAGAGRRAMQIATLGNNPMKDETSDRLLNDSTAATIGAAAVDIGTLAGGGAALRAAGTIPQIASKAPQLGRAMQATGQAMFAPKTIPTAAAVGGGYSAATTDGSLDDRLLAGATGTVGGALGGAAPRLLGGAMHQTVDPAVADLAQRGVRMTPGQILGGTLNKMEQKATSLPWIGDKIADLRLQSMSDWNVAAYNEALKPLGKMVSGTGREAARSAYDQVGKVYDKAVKNVTFNFDVGFDQRLAQIARKLDPDQLDAFTKIVNNDILPRIDPKKGLTGQAFKEVTSDLKTQARGYASSATQKERNFGEALRAVEDAMVETARKYSPTSAMKQLDKADQAYAALERVGGAAGKLGAKEGHFTPSQLLSEVRAKETSRLPFRKGEAMMQKFAEQADPVLSTRVADSGTSGRWALGGLGAGMFIDPVTTAAAGAGLYAGTKAVSEPMRGMMQAALTRQSPNALTRQVAEAMRLAAPYTAGMGMMLSPTVYSGQ